MGHLLCDAEGGQNPTVFCLQLGDCSWSCCCGLGFVL